MSRFERAFALLRVHEGGYSDHPRDPGGATMKGVTQRVYDEYRRRMGRPTKHVRQISDAEVETIYRQQYWHAVKADDLPPGIAYCVFDAAVNSGPGRAARWLQQSLGVKVDGVIGNQTIGAAREADPAAVINAYCDRRLAFMRRLRHWSSFKNGWTRRVSDVRAQSVEWARQGGPRVAAVSPEHLAKAEGDEKLTATIKDMARNPAALATAGSSLGAVSAVMEGDGPVQYALAATLVIGALGGLFWLVRGRNVEN